MDELKIGLAALRLEDSIDAGVGRIEETLARCGDEDVDVVCFPETYLPGLRGGSLEHRLPDPDQAANERALERIRDACDRTGTAAIVGMEWLADRGLHNRAYVVSGTGEVLGYQTKNQITPGGESDNYVPDGERALFEVNGVPFGVVVCHEGWRYPETVRWAATRGARIVFQPQWTGRDGDWADGDHRDRPLSERGWGTTFYEQAMRCRAEENEVFFASVNLAMDYQNSATTLLEPDGTLLDAVPYGEEQLLVAEVDPSSAQRTYAKRYDPALYPD